MSSCSNKFRNHHRLCHNKWYITNNVAHEMMDICSSFPTDITNSTRFVSLDFQNIRVPFELQKLTSLFFGHTQVLNTWFMFSSILWQKEQSPWIFILNCLNLSLVNTVLRISFQEKFSSLTVKFNFQILLGVQVELAQPNPTQQWVGLGQFTILVGSGLGWKRSTRSQLRLGFGRALEQPNPGPNPN